MPARSKQADRNAGKKARNHAEDDVAEASSSLIAERAKTLVMASVLAEVAPKLPNILKDGIAIVKGEKGRGEKKDSNEESDKENPQQGNEEQVLPPNLTEKDLADQAEKKNAKDAVPDYLLEKDVCAIFGSMRCRLHWSNPLGLATPASGEESLRAWVAFKSLEIDFGPRAKRNGNPGMDRVLTNVRNNLPQYLHILLALMVLRAFLFRSFFACLPWLVGYQFLSVLLPLDELQSLPRIPLDKVPVEFRVVAVAVLNGLLQLFFLFELVWKAWFYEKFLVIGLLIYHAYAVRPVDL